MIIFISGLTQTIFAKYMGMSVKTVEAWESGRNHPNGTSCRIFALTRKDPELPFTSGVLSQILCKQ
nr:helix-turn-helix domain-containing protein [Clostridia bacterium]